MNGLEIADERIREKELLTAEIFLDLVLKVAAIDFIFQQFGIKLPPCDERRFYITAHIAAEKAAERILANRKSGLK